jgi:hypothetical protein
MIFKEGCILLIMTSGKDFYQLKLKLNLKELNNLRLCKITVTFEELGLVTCISMMKKLET